jgi:hypothetical protein
MKALLSMIISAGIIIAALILGMALSMPAEASCYSSGSGCTTPTPTTSTTSISSDESTENVVKGVVIGAVIACAAISIYNGRWCWQEKQEPLAEVTPLTVAPDPQRPDQFYMLEVR